MPENLKALVVLLYLTGLRIGEALALKWSDVDVEQSKLYVRRSVWRRKEQTPKSRRSVRAKHLLGGLKGILQSHRELCVSRQPEDYLFAMVPGALTTRTICASGCSIRLWTKLEFSAKLRGRMASICSDIQPDRRCRKSRAI